jgi:peptidyl-prolyl cis-trans isomerase C
VLVLACAVFAVQVRADSRAVATVGTRAITVDRLLRVLAERRASGNLTAVISTMQAEGRRQVLDSLVEEELLAIAARQQKLDAHPAVQDEIDAAAAGILARHFRSWAASPDALDDQAVRAYFDEHPDEFRTRRRAKVRHIVVPTRSEAEKVLAELASGVPFETLAAKFSTEAGSKDKGGEIGWVRRGLMVKSFEDAAFALAPGQIGGPVQTGFGFHVIRVDEVDEPRMPDFESVRGEARARAAAARIAEVRRDLEKRVGVTIHDDVLTSLGK